MFPDAEVTAIKIEFADDPTHPLHATYHLEAPRYAQVTGKRLLFQTFPFHRAIASPFSCVRAPLAVEFPYAWKEFDQILFKLPAHWALDNADSPGRMEFGKPGYYDGRAQHYQGQRIDVQARICFRPRGQPLFSNPASIRK